MIRLIQTLLLSLFWLISIADAAISITQLQDSSVYQYPHSGRTPGTFPVISGTYTGTPTTISAQVRNFANDTVVLTWTVIKNSPTGGTFADTLKNIPRGGWYRICARTSIDGDSIAGTTRWGVGEIVGFFGQSNIAPHSVYTVSVKANALSRKRYAGSDTWYAMNSAPMSVGDSTKNNYVLGTMCDALIALNGAAYPIGICGYSSGGTSMMTGAQYWAKLPANHYDTTTLYGRLLSNIYKSKPGNIIMVQGEADYQQATRAYIDTARLLFSRLETDLGYKPNFCIVQTREIGGGTDYLLDMSSWLTIPVAHDSLCNDTSIFKAASTYQLSTYDGAHYDSIGQVLLGKLIAKSLIKIFNGTITSTYRFKIDSIVPVERGVVRLYANSNILSAASNLFSFSSGSVTGITTVLRQISGNTMDLIIPGKRFESTCTVQYDRYRSPNYGRGPAVYSTDTIPLEVNR